MKIVIITSLPKSNFIKKISKNFHVEYLIIEQRKSFKYIIKYYFRRFSKKPVQTFLEIFYQFYKIIYDFEFQKDVDMVKENNTFFTLEINSKITEDIIIKKKPDIILLFGTSIIKKNIFNIPSFGTINIHTGINPKYRGGGNPWAFINDDVENIGYTIHFVNAGIDTGQIIRRETLPIPHNVKSLLGYRSYCTDIAINKLIQVIDQIKKNKLTLQKIPSGEVSKYYPQLNILTFIKAELKFQKIKKKYF
jgi:methionyl-tRNA formyltransferase